MNAPTLVIAGCGPRGDAKQDHGNKDQKRALRRSRCANPLAVRERHVYPVPTDGAVGVLAAEGGSRRCFAVAVGMARSETRRMRCSVERTFPASCDGGKTTTGSLAPAMGCQGTNCFHRLDMHSVSLDTRSRSSSFLQATGRAGIR